MLLRVTCDLSAILDFAKKNKLSWDKFLMASEHTQIEKIKLKLNMFAKILKCEKIKVFLSALIQDKIFLLTLSPLKPVFMC